MHWFIAMLVGCSTDPGELRSEPTEPTVEVVSEQPETVTWKTLQGLLSKERGTFPGAVGSLRLGQPAAEARAILDAAKHPKLAAPAERVFDDITVVSAPLASFDTVGVTLFLQAGLLHEVDVSLPADEALFALTETWGAPDDQVSGNSTVPVPRWKGERMMATLIHTDKPVAILKYSKAD